MVFFLTYDFTNHCEKCTDRIALFALGKHNNNRYALFPRHSPEVIHCSRKRALTSDVLAFVRVSLTTEDHYCREMADSNNDVYHLNRIVYWVLLFALWKPFQRTVRIPHKISINNFKTTQSLTNKQNSGGSRKFAKRVSGLRLKFGPFPTQKLQKIIILKKEYSTKERGCWNLPPPSW